MSATNIAPRGPTPPLQAQQIKLTSEKLQMAIDEFRQKMPNEKIC